MAALVGLAEARAVLALEDNEMLLQIACEEAVLASARTT
jgi:hypothetical protein